MQRTARRSDASPPRNCSHEPRPFVQASAKAEVAGSVETQPRGRLAALTAFCIVDVPIRSPGNKDVRSQRIVFGFHCRKLGLDITYRRSESFQCILKARRTHDCSIEHIGCGASSSTRGNAPGFSCLLTRDEAPSTHAAREAIHWTTAFFAKRREVIRDCL